MSKPDKSMEVRHLERAIELETSTRLISFAFSDNMLLMTVGRTGAGGLNTITVPLDREDAGLLLGSLQDAMAQVWPTLRRNHRRQD